MVICRAVSDVDFRDFTSTFNRAYSDYYVPISMTISSFRALMARDDLDMDVSVAAVDDAGKIVGTGLLGIRGKQGWIGGMGVVPEHRRQGIGRQMMEYLIQQAREHGLEEVKLEVIEENVGAHKLYRDLGFEDGHILLVLDRSPDTTTFEYDHPYQVEERAPSGVLKYYPEFHSMPNCWQRDLPSLEALTPFVQSWAMLETGRIVGYGLGWADAQLIRLLDIAILPNENHTSAAQALLEYLHQQYPEAYGSSYNIAEDDPVIPAFYTLGYKVSLRQIEMRLRL
jgi:ribosomal protein S18 acetylase RimI-like enzyme